MKLSNKQVVLNFFALCAAVLATSGVAEAQKQVQLRCADVYQAAAGSTIAKAELYQFGAGCTFELSFILRRIAGGEIVFATGFRDFRVTDDVNTVVFKGTPNALLAGSELFHRETGEQLNPGDFTAVNVEFTPHNVGSGQWIRPDGITCRGTNYTNSSGRQYQDRYYSANDYEAYVLNPSIRSVWKCARPIR